MHFNALYEKHKAMVYNLALQYVQNREEAEEITQDVFISIHKNYSRFRQEAEVSTWMYRITINKSLDAIRSRSRKKRFSYLTSLFGRNEAVTDPIDFDHPGVKLEQKETLQHIFNALNSLPDRQKTALILSKIERKPLSEVAEIMQVSNKALESLLMRAKTGLGKKLQQNEGMLQNKRQSKKK